MSSIHQVEKWRADYIDRNGDWKKQVISWPGLGRIVLNALCGPDGDCGGAATEIAKYQKQTREFNEVHSGCDPAIYIRTAFQYLIHHDSQRVGCHWIEELHDQENVSWNVFPAPRTDCVTGTL